MQLFIFVIFITIFYSSINSFKINKLFILINSILSHIHKNRIKTEYFKDKF